METEPNLKNEDNLDPKLEWFHQKCKTLQLNDDTTAKMISVENIQMFLILKKFSIEEFVYS